MLKLLVSEQIIFHDGDNARNSAKLELLKELSSKRRAIEESTNKRSAIAESIAGEMMGLSYQTQQVPLLNCFSHLYLHCQLPYESHVQAQCLRIYKNSSNIYLS